AIAAAASADASAEPRVLDARLHHLRAGPKREWADFNEQPEAARLTLRFESAANIGEWSLRLRQQDVRQTWKVVLNAKEIAGLRPDETDMIAYFPVPAGAVVAGENPLTIEQVGNVPDDVRVGEIFLDGRPPARALGDATVEVAVTDGQAPLPCRITVTTAQG